MSTKIRASVDLERQLVKVVTVDQVNPHSNADRLDVAIVGGWQCCVKKGEFVTGDKALYCEIDSLLPISHPLFAFLEERKNDVKLVNSTPYARIKTIRLRGELSQGLLIPIPADFNWDKAETLTRDMGVLKYEGVPEASTEESIEGEGWFLKLVRWVRGYDLDKLQKPWPTFLPKSSQNRVQNIFNRYNHAVAEEETFEVTVKLEGESMTIWSWDNGTSYTPGVASRNNELITVDTVWPFIRQLRYWLSVLLACNRRMFRTWRFTIPRWKYGNSASEDNFVAFAKISGIWQKLKEHHMSGGASYALQGELVGPGIRKNYEGLKKVQFFIYNVYSIDGNGTMELSPAEAREVVQMFGLDYVPVIDADAKLPATIQECLKGAEGKGAFGAKQREGLVYKSNQVRFSFKAISNGYLLSGGEE